MRENHTEILVVGATFAGMGMALADSVRVKVIEPSGSVGPEFISAMRYGTDWNRGYTHSLAERIDRELRDRNAMDDQGHVHLPALHPVICRYLLEGKSPIQFLTRPMNFKRVGDAWEVTSISPSGVEKMQASCIVDTTSAGVLVTKDSKEPKMLEKLVNVCLYDQSEKHAIEELREAGYRVQEGRFPGEVTWSVPLEKDEGWLEARKKIGDIWSKRPSHLRSWTIAATATAFDIRMEKGIYPVAERFLRFPSAAYENPMLALEAGCEYMINQVKGVKAV